MKKHYKILLHILFWIYYFFWGDISRQLYRPGSHFAWSELVRPLALSGYIVFCSTFYINYLFIMPRLFKRKRYLLTWAGWIVLIFYFISARYLIEEVFYLQWFGIRNYFKGTTISFYIIDNIYFSGTIIIASILFWTIETWMQSEKEKMALQQEKTNAELSFLKSQVNPHFLFNTLNNIYSLVYHKSDKSLSAILKLSELMRYMTRESDADHILLSKEIQYIENFIELQSLITIQCIFTVSRRKYHPAFAANDLHELYARDFRHLYIKENEIGIALLYQL